jgi:hypothetical protein
MLLLYRSQILESVILFSLIHCKSYLMKCIHYILECLTDKYLEKLQGFIKHTSHTGIIAVQNRLISRKSWV